jgi:hypothetical protein
MFSQVSYPLTTLVGLIETGSLGLPELQRPFVWDRAQVRDLFDSLYRGYPAGAFLFWRTGSGHGTKTIGADAKQQVAATLIVDGQQRLTSIYAVVKGVPVVDEDFRESEIRLAFRPRTGEFEVANSANAHDPEWIPSITPLWAPDANAFGFTSEFIARLRETKGLTDDEEKEVANAITRLIQLTAYTFTAIELASEMEVEEVSQVFVRVNSKGTPLNAADFILTLMSVYWDEGRRELEAFSRAAKTPSSSGPSPFNYFLRPSPDQMLRVAIGLGLRRGQLRAVYQLLRGRSVTSNEVSDQARDEQFAKLAQAQAHVLDLTHWHEFLKALQQAGYRSQDMVTSDNNILFSYLAFLVGRVDHGIAYPELRKLIARWFFMCSVTGRYTGTPESRIESDLRRFADAKSGDAFETILDEIIGTNLTSDFWTVALPDTLDSASAYSPALFAYHASLCLLNAKALFSDLAVSDLLDPALQGKKKALERHHLFPKAYLKSIGVSGVSSTNQIANMALLEWPDNISISDAPPSQYFPEMFAKHVDPKDQEAAYFWHALPAGWEEMEYKEFLKQRRTLMAQVIRAGYDKLVTGVSPFAGAGQPDVMFPTVESLLEAMETAQVEFKSSARVSLDGDEVPEKAINGAVIKSVAAFLNSDGGTLGIGIQDDGAILGIQPDLDYKDQDLDSYANWLTTLFITALGAAATTRVGVRFEAVGEATVCLVDVRPSSKPVFAATDKGKDLFFVRLNNTTRVLSGADVITYAEERWGA